MLSTSASTAKPGFVTVNGWCIYQATHDPCTIRYVDVDTAQIDLGGDFESDDKIILDLRTNMATWMGMNQVAGSYFDRFVANYQDYKSGTNYSTYYWRWLATHSHRSSGAFGTIGASHTAGSYKQGQGGWQYGVPP